MGFCCCLFEKQCITLQYIFLFFLFFYWLFFYATFLSLSSLVSHLWWNNQWFIQSGLLVLHTFSALRVFRRIANNFTSSVWLRSGFCTVCTSVPDQSMTCFASFHRPTPQNHKTKSKPTHSKCSICSGFKIHLNSVRSFSICFHYKPVFD